MAQVQTDASWVLTAQLPDGAIANYVDQRSIWPYLSNYAAIGLARATELTRNTAYAAAAWRWLGWYQAHQDANGFVTDYRLTSGAETSTGDMDSTDAYAGMFLLAVRATWLATHDTARLRGLHHGIAAAVAAIEATQDGDGLTWAKPSWHVKYLMDEAEAYGGLVAAAGFGQPLDDTALANNAAGAAARLQNGAQRLWNPALGAYNWALHSDGAQHPTNWSVLYPDAMEQMWPVAFGLVTGARARSLVTQFAAAQPNWDRPAATALFDSGPSPIGYWAVAAWAMARVGDTSGAGAATDQIRAAALAANRAWPFTTADAGQLITGAGGSPTAILP
jgi:hypothetical protein